MEMTVYMQSMKDCNENWHIGAYLPMYARLRKRTKKDVAALRMAFESFSDTKCQDATEGTIGDGLVFRLPDTYRPSRLVAAFSCPNLHSDWKKHAITLTTDHVDAKPWKVLFK